MGGELSKREGVLLHSFQSEAGSFCCSIHRFTKIYALITISLLDIGYKWCFVISFFCFERVHLAMRGCTCALRECTRTLKTPNYPPLLLSSKEWNINSVGAAVQHNFRHTLLVPSREEKYQQPGRCGTA